MLYMSYYQLPDWIDWREFFLNWMDEREVSQVQLARWSNVSRLWLGKYLRGQSSPTLNMTKKVYDCIVRYENIRKKHGYDS